MTYEGDHGGNVLVNSRPDDRSIHPEICMDHLIPDSHHLAPGNVGIALFEMLWDLFCCFPDNFQGSDRCIYRLFVGEKLLL